MTDYLKSILNAFHDLIFVFNKNGIIDDYIATNHENELILPKEQFLGKDHRDVLPPHVSKKITQAFYKLDQGEESYTFDYRIEINGTAQWYTAVLSKIENLESSQYLGAVRNITSRKNQELLLKSILNTSPGGIIVFESIRNTEGTIIDYKITQVNKSVEVLTGAPAKQLVGQSMDVITDDTAKEIVFNHFNDVTQNGKPVEFQYKHIDKRGKVFWYHSKIVKYGDGVVSTFMDISTQKEAEIKLSDKNEELEEVNRQKNKLISVISHDLRNAVAGSMGVTDLLLEDYEQLSKDEILEYLQLLNLRTHNTHELMEDLLDWSKNQLKEVSTDLEKVRLASLVNTTFDNVRSHADNKEIDLLNQIPEAIYLRTDASMLKTVLRNLVTNGIKFSNPGGKIVLNAEKENETLKISVNDDGIGMNEETQKKVLNSHINFTSQGTSGERGSGIGLGICVDFVEKNGGDIWVESEPGDGSTFYISLPFSHS